MRFIKKGFTLIELLAVIVLMGTLIVLNVINGKTYSGTTENISKLIIPEKSCFKYKVNNDGVTITNYTCDYKIL